MKKLFLILLVGLMVSTVADAVQVRARPSCGQWISSDGVVKSAFNFWLLGYLSGMAIYSNRNILEGTDNESINLWMDNYCKVNPLSTLSDATHQLVLELKIN